MWQISIWCRFCVSILGGQCRGSCLFLWAFSMERIASEGCMCTAASSKHIFSWSQFTILVAHWYGSVGQTPMNCFWHLLCMASTFQTCGSSLCCVLCAQLHPWRSKLGTIATRMLSPGLAVGNKPWKQLVMPGRNWPRERRLSGRPKPLGYKGVTLSFLDQWRA